MLGTDIAQKIVDKISQSMNYTLTIVDLKGIVIASRDESRVGLFHPIASKMISEKREMDMITSSNVTDNVNIGVCLMVHYDGKVMGVMEISGNPEEILSMSYIVKLSAETIIEYEMFKEKIRIRSDKKEMFLNALLKQTDISEAQIRHMAGEMGVNLDLPRTSILIDCPHKGEQILRIITENPLHSHQDITSITPEGDVLVLKTIDSSLKKSISQFREDVGLYCENAAELLLKKHGMSFAYLYVGSLQKDISCYKLSVQHSIWLKNHISREYGVQRGTYFFMDQMSPYMQSQLPPSVFPPVFSSYAASMSEEEKANFIEIGDALYKSQMNLTQCSRLLYVHRNTLTMKINKIKQTFGIDPVNNMADQQFFLHFLYFLKSTMK